MKVLVVEDDFVSRRLVQMILTPYGQCDISVNGREAVEAVKMALQEGEPYSLVCLDIMMPEMDGHEVLIKIRDMEKKYGINGLEGTKVIMTTALGDFKNVKQAFIEQCEAYLVKPIDKKKLMEKITGFGLI